MIIDLTDSSPEQQQHRQVRQPRRTQRNLSKTRRVRFDLNANRYELTPTTPPRLHGTSARGGNRFDFGRPAIRRCLGTTTPRTKYWRLFFGGEYEFEDIKVRRISRTIEDEYQRRWQYDSDDSDSSSSRE